MPTKILINGKCFQLFFKRLHEALVLQTERLCTPTVDFRFPAMSSIHLLKVCLEMGTFSFATSFLMPTLAESTKQSLMNSASENGLLCFVILWEIIKLLMHSWMCKACLCCFCSSASKGSDVYSCSASIKFLYFSACSVS